MKMVQMVWVVLALALGTAGIAQGTIMFNDTCDQDVRTNWADPWNGCTGGRGPGGDVGHGEIRDRQRRGRIAHDRRISPTRSTDTASAIRT